eukprot:2993754-Rhodomonas_salina.1
MRARAEQVSSTLRGRRSWRACGPGTAAPGTTAALAPPCAHVSEGAPEQNVSCRTRGERSTDCFK